jgi:hypothetical protein
MRYLLDFLRAGLWDIAEPFVTPREYIRPSGFAKDRARLIGDVRQVGSDMRKAIGEHGQRTYTTPGP